MVGFLFLGNGGTGERGTGAGPPFRTAASFCRPLGPQFRPPARLSSGRLLRFPVPPAPSFSYGFPFPRFPVPLFSRSLSLSRSPFLPF